MWIHRFAYLIATGLRDKGLSERRERRGTRFDLLILERLGQFNIFCPVEKEFLVVALRFRDELILVDSFN